MSEAKESIVPGMTYGDVRKKLNLLYRLKERAQPNMAFYDGMTFGEFSLRYVIAKHTSRGAEFAQGRSQRRVRKGEIVPK